ncbi:MAG: TraR/DksA family transcriptional regulator [Candidatus Scalindua sp.]|jgi:DnaK suppressor protein|nr:TraR/DksA family transcriptional regulator [Candidatus Scalindua sp.]MBT5305288.1 TraR/DksA family transcriptional regulator [Candidatus Scalindua sp.]MBT6052611.1 TraR/DksA family transcriptional regulator [Candidatus Scalindua sp.]MBT6227384.1 TraR/DksA family transcriptional regulator [Candidatus Scalindua sp.]MBT6562860.1 TraR/DksA family transcriptional regulator [Candidatus Scalindua sp.]
MTKKFINQLVQRLKDRREYLLSEVKLRLGEFKNSGTDRLSDTADIASNLIEDEIVMSIAQGEANEIEQIDNALIKIKEGKYGTCGNCGKSINKPRLMAIPFVNLCIKCKEDEERYEGSGINSGSYSYDTVEYAGIEADDEKRSNLKNFDLNDVNPYDN